MKAPFVKKHGQGKTPLVMLHGWGATHEVFEPLLPFIETEFDIFLVDLPGFGKSEWQPGLTIEKMAEQVAKVSPTPAVYLGWSLGSMVALCVAHYFKEQTIGLVNVAGSPAFCQAFWPYGIATAALQQFALQLQKNPEQVRHDFLNLHIRNTALSPEMKASLSEKIHKGPFDPNALVVTTEWLQTVDLRKAWEKLTIPALSVLGSRDILLPQAAIEQLEALNPRVETHVFQGASHSPFLDDPAEFSKVLIEFVTRHV